MSALVAAAVAAAVALIAWRAGALTGSGAAASVAVGLAVLWSTGWGGAAVLGAFFLPSTLAGRWALRRGAVPEPAGERRDARQVLANGAAAALGSLAEHSHPGLGLWTLTASLAAAAADTWATSMGVLSTSLPRHLLTGRPVPRGSSGGVSLRGTLGALPGAAFVAGTGALAGGGLPLLTAGIAIGFVGMLLDSLLGAVLQGRFECDACGEPAELSRHRCGTPTRLVGGWRWLDNNGVNALSTLAAALAGGVAWRLLAA